MSPEQVRGKELDARTDLFSFGAVLYEMATGALPFRAETSAMICEAIVNRAPNTPLLLNPDLPADLERIINKALEKDRDLRYRSAADLETDLKRLKRDTDSGRAPLSGATAAPASRTEATRRLLWLKWTALAALVLVAAAVVLEWLRTPLPPPRILAPKQITNDRLPKSDLVTDGNRIYFNEALPGSLAVAQVASSGGETVTLNSPFPDALVADVASDGSELLMLQAINFGSSPYWSVPIPAGSPRRLGDITGLGGVWAPDGKLIFGKGTDLYIAEHDGTNPRKFAAATDSPGSVRFSPDAKRIRFTSFNAANSTSAIYEARSDGSNIHPLFPGWNNPSNECCGRWTSDGRY